jgi:hypothetical protein
MSVHVTFKHEDEIDGMPVGPVTIWDDDEPREPRPFDPNREPQPWITLADAERAADELGVTLEES